MLLSLPRCCWSPIVSNLSDFHEEKFPIWRFHSIFISCFRDISKLDSLLAINIIQCPLSVGFVYTFLKKILFYNNSLLFCCVVWLLQAGGKNILFLFLDTTRKRAPNRNFRAQRKMCHIAMSMKLTDTNYGHPQIRSPSLFNK